MVIAAGLAATLAPAASARVIYDCTLEGLSNNHGWVPTEVVVAYEPGAEEVQVADPMIQDVHGGPISVVPTRDSEGVLSLSWKLVLEATNGNELPVRYNFTINKADNKAKIRAEPLGYDNYWASRGRCKVSKD